MHSKGTEPLAAYSGIAGVTMARVHEFFERKTQHRPSEQTYRALGELVGTLTAMAKGTAEPKFHLSSLDPGQGKTTCIAQFTKTLVEWPIYDHVGVLICVGRLSEIEKLVAEMKLPPSMFACLTTDDAINALGSGSHNARTSRVLFTTQQKVAARVPRRAFSDCSEFFFGDAPRKVRIWDEAWLPGSPVTLGKWEIMSVVGRLGLIHPQLAAQLDALLPGINESDDGAELTLPDFASSSGVSAQEVGRLLSDAPLEEQAWAQGLWHMSGRAVVVRKDQGDKGGTALTYRDIFPMDLAPMLILDASGRVRGTYELLIEQRKVIKPLATSHKRYDKLETYIWRASGSKTGWRKNSEQLVSGVCETIRNEPDRSWLVVHHLPEGRRYGPKIPDIAEEVRAALGPLAANVQFTTWGKHVATNEFKDCDRIILAGTLFYRVSTYEALTRLSAGKPVEAGKCPVSWIEAVTLGEAKDQILQAACRGIIRNSEGDQAPAAKLYIIASAKSGIRESLPSIFPGCSVGAWEPGVIDALPRGKIEDTASKLAEYLRALPGETRRVSIRALKGALALRDMPMQTFRDARDRALELTPDWAVNGKSLIKT